MSHEVHWEEPEMNENEPPVELQVAEAKPMIGKRAVVMRRRRRKTYICMVRGF